MDTSRLKLPEISGAGIFSNYLAYMVDTEPPVVYHRWCWLTTLGAAIGRKAWLQHGSQRLFPNIYVMLIGSPSARKSSSIKNVKKIFSNSGYDNFSSDKTTKEKFLLDLEGKELDDTDDLEQGRNNNYPRSKAKLDAVTAENLWGTSSGDPREMYIVADEFNDFAGIGNLEFFTTLGSLWDYDDPERSFKQRLKNSRSVAIFQPTVSLLAGNTPTLFSKCFPPEAIGNGFLARLLLIYGERSSRKITWPAEPDGLLKISLVKFLEKLQGMEIGNISVAPEAYKLLDIIYQTDEGWIQDFRFTAYNQRRFTHLLKICIILTAARFSSELTDEVVIEANTILSAAEMAMPKALGEFGKGKNSDVASNIMHIIDDSIRPMGFNDLWKEVRNDLNSQRELVEIINGLIQADKIQTVSGKNPGFLPKRVVKKKPVHVDWSLLTDEERQGLG